MHFKPGYSSIPNGREIKGFIHCSLCGNQQQDIEVGMTSIGFQVWCRRHQCNIIHIDFEGKAHPANTNRKPPN